MLQAIETYEIQATTRSDSNSTSLLQSTAKLPRPLHNIPIPRNTHFLARQQELSDISRALEQSSVSPQMKSFTLWGLGGVGKTQIAIEYAYKALDSGLQVILWVNCETSLSISSSFTNLALMLRLPGVLTNDNTNQNRLLVLNWLRTTRTYVSRSLWQSGVTNLSSDESWLLVFDNAEDPDLVQDCWPVAVKGSILVTSRRPIFALRPAAGGMEVGHFSDDDGATLLLRIVNKYPYDTREENAARQLSKELGGHGLALRVMAALIHLKRKSFTEFISFYLRNRENLHVKSSIETGNTHSLRTCWHTAFEALEKEPSIILGLMSFIAPDEIPEEMFRTQISTPLPKALAFCNDELA